MKEGQQLAAIMFTDIVGYTALMGKDVALGLALIHKNRQIHKPLIEKYGGSYLKEMGDGTLASFNTAIDAVSCAIEI
ncbi:MAG: adenylate/guanylate cyclase domain-containing protein, partial [Maribacter sp.]|nr:adenylate/guanylate cyclase domain-containing protein [Maribacter sp.]